MATDVLRPISPIPQSPTHHQAVTDARSKLKSSADFSLSLIEQNFKQLDPRDEGLSTERIQLELRFLLGCSTLSDEECTAIVLDMCADDHVKRRDFLSSFKEFAADCSRARRSANPLTGGAARLHTRSSSFWNLVRKATDSPSEGQADRPLSPHSPQHPLHQSPLHKQQLRRLQGIHLTPSSKQLMPAEHQKTEFGDTSPMSAAARSLSSASDSSSSSTKENQPRSSPAARTLSFSDDLHITEVSSPRADRINELEDNRATLALQNQNLINEQKKLSKELEKMRAQLGEVSNEKHRLLADIQQKDTANQSLSEELKLARAKAKQREAKLQPAAAHLPAPETTRPRSSSFRTPTPESLHRQEIEVQAAQLTEKDEQIAALQKRVRDLEEIHTEMNSHLQELQTRNDSATNDEDGLNFTSMHADIPEELSMYSELQELDPGSMLFDESAIVDAGDVLELPDQLDQQQLEGEGGEGEEGEEGEGGEGEGEEGEGEGEADDAEQPANNEAEEIEALDEQQADVQPDGESSSFGVVVDSDQDQNQNQDPDQEEEEEEEQRQMNGLLDSQVGERSDLDHSEAMAFCALLTEHTKYQQDQLDISRQKLEEATRRLDAAKLVDKAQSRSKATVGIASLLFIVLGLLLFGLLLLPIGQPLRLVMREAIPT